MRNVDFKIPTKLFYRFIEFVSKCNGSKLTHERYKLICLNQYKLETEEDRKVASFADAYDFILSNLNQTLDERILLVSYFILTKKRLSKTKIVKILSSYYQNYNENTRFLSLKVHLEILKQVKYRRYEFAFMISNLILLNKGCGQLIPYGRIFKLYKEAIKENNDSKLLYFFNVMEHRIELINDTHFIEISIDEVSQLIHKKKDYIKSNFNVKRLFLYGSKAKNKVFKSSDIDFLIVMDENLSLLERNKKVKLFSEFLSDLLNNKVDLIDFTSALRNLDICEMENIISVL